MQAEIFKTRKQLYLRVPTFRTRYYFRLVGDNGEVIAQSEAYTAKQSASATVHKYFPKTTIRDLT